MTTLDHLHAAQQAHVADEGRADDWEAIAWRLASNLALARNLMSFGYARLRLFDDGPKPKLKLDAQEPIT